MSNHSNFQNAEAGIPKTFRNDFRQTKIKEEFKSEYKDLKQYFLSSDRYEKLALMNPLKKFFVLPWWIIKAMYFRLTPFRRILLIIGLFLLLMSFSIENSNDGTTLSLNVSAFASGIIFL